MKTRREYVRPLLPSIRHGGEALVLGEQAVRVIWQAQDRRLLLDANLSPSPSSFRRVKSGRSGVVATLKPRSAPGASVGRSNRHERSPRDLSPAAARGLWVQRGGGDRALFGAAWRQSRLFARRSSKRARAACTATISPITTSSIPNSGPRPTMHRWSTPFAAKGSGEFSTSPITWAYGAPTIRCGLTFWNGGRSPDMRAGSTSIGRPNRASCWRLCLARNMARN